MNSNFRLAAAIAASLPFLVTGCLSFGDDVELSGSDFDAAILARVETITGLKFPAGSDGLDYFYQGSGIDDALAARVKIPAAERTFLKNTAFTGGKDSKPTVQIGKSKSWWNLSGLKNPVHRTQNLPSAEYLEVSLGEEGADLVVYISWMST